MKKILSSLCLVLALAACKPQISDDQLEKAVGNYIEKNPDKVFEAVKKGAENAQNPKTDENVLENAKKEILASSDHAVLGNVNSENVLIEFYDYNCGYCKRAFETVMRFANQDKIKVVLVELPVLGPTSYAAGKASVVVNKIAPEKFLPFHKALLLSPGHIEEATIFKAAKNAGIDVNQLKAELARPEYDTVLENNMKIAQSLHINGTPNFIVNNTIFPGALPYEEMKKELK